MPYTITQVKSINDPARKEQDFFLNMTKILTNNRNDSTSQQNPSD
jgi:hypothetical protein